MSCDHGQCLAFDQIEDLVEWLAEKIQAISITASASRPGHISLSGGTTPKKLYARLAKPPYNKSIQWQNLHLWWGDERLVSPFNADEQSESNFYHCQKLLLNNIDIPDANIHRIRGENSPEDELLRARQELLQLFTEAAKQQGAFPAFDLIILGMGEDGHTASLFPGGIDLESSEWLELAEHPLNGQLRISVTLGLINAARQVCFMVTGKTKSRTLNHIFSLSSEAQLYPAAKVKPKNGELHWLLDSEAAAGIAVINNIGEQG